MNPSGEVAGFPLFAPEAPFEQVQAALEARDLGDGLPLVPPTRLRMAAMLEGLTSSAINLSSSTAVGAMPPLFGELRPDAVAYQCLLAGCYPHEIAVVWTAANACLDPRFNLLGLLTTTGTPAIAVVVHGPLAQDLKVNSSTNCLGPGARSNACIGRALSLVMLNIAGARPGIADMATMGQPGKFTFCFAESHHPHFPALPARRGFPADQSAVTVIGVSGTAEVLAMRDGRTPQDILQPVAGAMASAIAVSSAGKIREPGEQIFLLPPELADRLAEHDWDLRQTQAFLLSACRVTLPGTTRDIGPIAATASHIHPIVTGGPGVKMTYIPGWAGGTRSITLAIGES